MIKETFAKAEEAVSGIKEYVNNRITSFKLNMAEKTAGIVSGLLSVLIASTLFLLFIIFLSVGLALVFAKLTGELYWGFFIVAGLYLVKGIIIWNFREKLLKLPIVNMMVKQLFHNSEKEDDEDI